MAGLGFIIFDSKCNVLFPNGPRMEDNNVAVKEQAEQLLSGEFGALIFYICGVILVILFVVMALLFCRKCREKPQQTSSLEEKPFVQNFVTDGNNLNSSHFQPDNTAVQNDNSEAPIVPDEEDVGFQGRKPHYVVNKKSITVASRIANKKLYRDRSASSEDAEY